MKSPNQFIVVPANERRYDNVKNVEGLELIINTSEESAEFSNREAVVLSTPLNYNGPIEEGDTILVHHNVFKYYNDMYFVGKMTKWLGNGVRPLIENQIFV